MSSTKFKITNITCAACVKLSTVALQKIKGVSKAVVDQTTGSVELVADREIAWNEITNALQAVGKQAEK